MDLSIISEILKDLVPFHSQISLPGLGCFVVDEKPSQITNGGTVITPPHKSLRFSFSIGTNDGLLEYEYSKIKNENAHDAKMSIEKLVREIKEQLTQNRKVKIPQLGELRFNENGELLFIPVNGISIFPASSQPPVVNIVPKESIEYSAPELPAAPAFDDNLMQHILESALTASIFAKNCRDAANSHTIAELEEKDNILPDNTATSPAESAQTAAETAQINNIEEENEGAECKEDVKDGDNEKIKDEDVSRGEEKNEAKDEEKGEEKGEEKDKAESETKGGTEEAAGENTKEENQQKTENSVKLEASDKENGTEKETKCHEAAKPEISKKQKWVAVILIALIIIILLITIVFVMQDELRPLLEKLLYNARERALIHHFNM